SGNGRRNWYGESRRRLKRWPPATRAIVSARRMRSNGLATNWRRLTWGEPARGPTPGHRAGTKRAATVSWISKDEHADRAYHDGRRRPVAGGSCRSDGRVQYGDG